MRPMTITWGGGRHAQARHERLQKSAYQINVQMRFSNFSAAHAEVLHGPSQMQKKRNGSKLMQPAGSYNNSVQCSHAEVLH